MNVISWCVFVILICVTKAQSSSLQPGGSNVETKYETYYTNVSTTQKNQKTTRVCRRTCTWIIFCKTVCSNRIYYVWETVYKTVSRKRAIYECKTGWKQDGNECTIPICTNGCHNNGTCTAPEVCNCTAQWNGTICNQDIDECDPTSGIRHGCQETCVNFPGGYNCTCPPGHFLTSNGKNCTDHDECAGNIHGCQQGCSNYPGGYRCTCRPGYTPNINDNTTCDGLECETIHSPLHGGMTCTGNTTDHSCKFSCDPGYELRGSRHRSCSARGKWTGDETLCKIVHCPKAPAPRHGFVYTPCDTPFRSKCIVGCMRGYFMAGEGTITCNSSGVWQPQNLSCTKMTACERNLCQHNSICTPVSSSRYICDCSNTGYRGINCHVGYITTPKYPRITAGIPSSPLEFRSSPLTSGHVILIPSSRDVTFTPSFLLFNSTFSRQSLTVASVKPGIYFIKYSISGPNAAEFSPPGNDIIFVDVIKNSTNQTTGNFTTNLVLPIGCHEFLLKKCPATDDVMISSTAPWEITGDVTSSSGVVVMRAGKTNIPLSLLGTSLPSNPRSPDEKRCDANQNYSVEQLTKNHVLTKSFLDALKDSFPRWLTLKLRREINRNSFYISDVNTQFLSGKELRQTLAGKGQPIAENSSFSLLHSPNINVTVENDGDILKSRDEKSRISLAVDLCSQNPKTIILRVPEKYANPIQNSSVLKRLKQNGWELTISSLQISKTNSIQTPFGKERFWDGEKLISSNFDMKGNLALLAKVKKSFVGKNLSSYLEFDGTTIISVGDLDSILRSPLDQAWLVDLYGNMKLTIQLAVEGAKTDLTFNAAESVSFATFGANPGQSERNIHQGLYISHTFETSPFVNSGLAKFIEISSKDGIEAFFKTKLHSTPANNETGRTSDHIEAVNMAFHGVLKFGLLRFEDVGMTLKTQSNETAKENSDGITLKGRARKNTTRKYGIFKPSNLHVQVYISRQDSRESVGLFESSVELLGFRNLVNVSFGLDGLSFNTTGHVHGLFETDLSGSSPLESWQNQRFVASGKFRSGEDSLVDTLRNTLRAYASHVYDRAHKRVAFFKEREQRAKNRLESILSVLEVRKQELNKSQVEYNISKGNLKAAEVRFKALQSNVSHRLDRLKARLNKFCPEVKQCLDICQAGVVCRHCKYQMAGKSKKTCLSTCYKTETRRVQTNSSSVPCKRQQCVRVYVKNGLVKRTLQQTLTRLQNDIFSFGRKASSRSESQNGLSKGEKAGLFPGAKKQDVCQYAEITSNAFPEKLCEADGRNGHWDCSIRTESCSTSGFQYERYHAPYTCERPCETHVTTEEISKSCCETVPCAFQTVNRTCVAENHFCNKIRIDALEKLAANTTSELSLLKDVEIAKGNLFYWQIQARNAEIRLKSAKSLFNFTQDTANSLREAYNVSVKSKQNISSLLGEKLNLKWIFDPEMSGIEFESASFKVKIQEGGNYLVPVKFGLKINGIAREFNAIVNFRAVNSSLSSIAKDMLDLYGKIGEESDSKRRRRSVESEEIVYALSSLQKYHKLCSEFTNYEQALHDMTISLFNLTSEAKDLIKNSVKRNATNTFNASKIFENFNSSQATALFGLEIDKESYLNSLENDRIMLAAHDLQNEALEDGFRPLHFNSKLLFRNWFSAMENIFNVVRVNGLGNCSGFEDCIVFITDSLFEMNEASGLPGSHEVRVMIGHLRRELGRLSINTNITLNEANEISCNILSILKDMREIKLFCARAPNITKQPERFTDVGEGRPLMLGCSATGDLLSYNWKLNDDYLTDQTTNTLYIIKVMSTTHSGYYTCVVTNHISMETSAPAVVLVHPAPHITIQPIKRLNAIVYTNDSLRCVAESTDNNMTYQWYFKAKNSSVFIKLISQKFSYLNFIPVKSQHEGWYYCNVSNFYGTIRSITNHVKVLNFGLPVPVARLSVTLRQSRNNVRVFKRSEPISIGYEDIQSKLAELLSFKNNRNATFNSTSNNSTTNSTMEFNPQVGDLHVAQCNAVPKFCQWIFQYIGTGNHVTGNGENFEQDANKVIGSLRELRKAIGRLVQAVDDGALAFDLGDQRFSVEKNSVGVLEVSSACSRGRKLEQNFRCVDCPPGYYGMIDDNAIATCVPCRVGSYQPNSGRTACTQCPEGFTTVQEGTTEKSQCQVSLKPVICRAGMYGQVTENVGRCLDCPANTYQPASGQFVCIQCPDGHVTATKGAKDISQCHPEPTTTRRPTERRTTPGKPTEPQRTTEKETRVTTGEEVHSPGRPGALSSPDDGNHTPAIGGAVGAFLFLVLLALVLLYFVRRRRIARKSSEPIDDKNVVVSDNGMELNSWNNPAFEEDLRDGTGHGENPMYVSGSMSPVTTENPEYEASPVYGVSLDFKEINLDTDTDAADVKVYGSHENGDVISHCRNPLYESNPARDKINESEPVESSDHYHEPDVSCSHDVSNFGNPLYEALAREHAHKSSTLKLNDDVIVDEDV